MPKTRKPRGVRATEAGIKKLEDAQAAKRWSHDDIAKASEDAEGKKDFASQKTVQRFLSRLRVQGANARAICKALDVDDSEVLESESEDKDKKGQLSSDPYQETTSEQSVPQNESLSETTIQTSSHVTTTSQNEISSNPNRNPFIPLSGKIEDEKLFFPRPIELNRIFEQLNNGANVALIGEEGVGKSSLLWAIRHHSSKRLDESRQAVLLDMNEISNSENEFYKTLCDEIKIPALQRNELNRELRDKKILLAIDNVGKLAREGFTRELRDWLRSKAEGIRAPIRLVLAANSPLEDLFQDSQNTSPLAGVCQTEKMGVWSTETIRSFISARLQNTNVKNFEESDIFRIIELSNGHPRELMKLCNQTYEQYIQRLR